MAHDITTVEENSTYSATISPSSGYTLTGAEVTITMGNDDITNSAFSNGNINISNVTGNVVITVSAVVKQQSSDKTTFYGSQVTVGGVNTPDIELNYDRFFIVYKSGTGYADNALFNGSVVGHNYAVLYAGDYTGAVFGNNIGTTRDNCEVYVCDLSESSKEWVALSQTQIESITNGSTYDAYFENDITTKHTVYYWIAGTYVKTDVVISNENIYKVTYNGTNGDSVLVFAKNYNQSDYE